MYRLVCLYLKYDYIVCIIHGITSSMASVDVYIEVVFPYIHIHTYSFHFIDSFSARLHLDMKHVIVWLYYI
jgi:hypothetical protein